MFFFFNDTATTEIYTLSLHDALPIFPLVIESTIQAVAVEIIGITGQAGIVLHQDGRSPAQRVAVGPGKSDEGIGQDRKSTRLNSSHAQYLVCRLLLEKKNIAPRLRLH